MSIAKGIEIRRKDPAKDRPFNERPCVSWKDMYVDMWIADWMILHEEVDEDGYYAKLGEDSWESSMSKTELLRMADDMINRRFDVCPDAYGYFSGSAKMEDFLALYGTMFSQLAERLQDDEMLVFYDNGD